MWTPRRVLLLVVGFAVVAGGFLVYLTFLGGYDGLPALPPAYLTKGDANTLIPVREVGTTVSQLQLAFGKTSAEGGADARVYRHRLPITGRSGVMAIGPPQTDNTPRVVVAPVSVALFGQRNPRPKPGEQIETTTLHADRAVITFDKPISRVEDMSTAKVLNLNLESDPDDDPKAEAAGNRDPRKGRTWISTNRKSADPSDHLVVRTVGPLFVQLPDEATPYNPNTKHIWTSAAVEVFDRRNLPRRVRARADALDNPEVSGLSAVGELLADKPVPPLAAPRSPEDLRGYDAVKDILTGRTLPPPTAVARGLEVYLAPAKKDPNAPPPPPGKGNNSFAGVREMVMGDGVQLCLWTEGGGGFPGTAPPPPATAGPKPADPPGPFADPPLGALALGGGLIDAGVQAGRLASRSLLVVSTPGQFRYNLENSFATFTAAGIAPDGGGNFVVATRLNAANQTDDLVCTKLTLDMTDPDATTKGGGGVVVRELVATGPQVVAAVQADGLDVACVELKHTRGGAGKPTVTTLRGTADLPVAVRQNGGRLTAGDPATAAVVTITDPPPLKDGKRRSTVAVSGPGRMELTDRDPDAGTPRTSVAQWAKRMDQEKVDKGGRVLDLFTLTEDAAFVDAANNFSLRGKELRVWVAGKDGPDSAKPTAGVGTVAAGGKPEQLVATTDVHLDSADLVVRRTNKLTVFFADIPPPKPPAKKDEPALLPVPKPLVPEGPKPAPVVPLDAPKPEPKPEPKPPAEPIPNPIQLQADTVEAWMGRYPVLPPVVAKDAPPPAPRTKYELQNARCDGGVIVHQDPDPNDPQRPTNGLDITGVKLLLKNAGPDGSVMTVYGPAVKPGEDERTGWAKVAHEDTVIFGPVVVIDQPNNVASVSGSGQLQSLTASDVAGNDLSSPSRLVIDWKERMKFEGAKSSAVFVGKVAVQQEAKADKPPAAKAPQPTPIVPVGQREELPKPREAGTFTPTDTLTQLWCHQLDLTLDRPVYFNQLRKDDRGRKPTPTAPGQPTPPAEPKPKVKLAVATPNADGAKAEDRRVLFRETATTADKKEVVRARQLVAKRMDFTNRAKEQELYAVGPGQLRLLQPHKDDTAPADPKAPPAAGTMKLTVVNFQSTMNGKDEGGVYQEATFDKGGTVLRTPTKNLDLDLEPHTLPKGGEYLRSEETLVVSASKAKKDGEAEQRLTATGNAEFRDENRTGVGDTIRHDGTRVTLEAGVGRLAALYANKRAVTQQQSMRAKKFVYNPTTGVVDVAESAGGSLLPGGR